ncbi:hypothetical protein [Pararhodospirillum photometricum]|uniref:Uncharacterized protein n=1 Tax=Pararhodospirillum photometricum DSM 122 TaxID=1150469 RepID=H6SPD7_PARPM|nr:hypothetical protein [Pararhodospirillum photometricum]CCG09462.1 unnamed protein product [Pararhodospirillum photometricum DSM 122]
MAYHAKAWILGVAALAFFGPAAAVEGPLTGVWRGPYGVFVLDQQGATVRGSTFYNEATLQGTLDGETLRFHWRDALGQEGDASLRLDPDQAELQVEWPLGGEAGLPVSWRAIRYAEPAAPPGQRSRWRVVMDLRDFPEAAGQVTGSADLFFAGDRVAGWLSGHFVPVAPDTGAPLAEGVEGIMVSYRIEGQQAGDTLRLSLLNPHDDSMTEAVVARRPEGLVGTWRDQSPSSGPLAAPPQQGTIHLTPEEGPPTPTPTEEAKARHRRLWQVAQHVGEAWASPLGGDPRRAIQAMIQRGAFKDAVQAADQMAQAAAAAGLPTLQADAMLLRANALSADGFFAEARDAYTRLQTHPGATAFHQDMAEAGLLSLSLHIGSVQPLAVPPLLRWPWPRMTP